MQASYFNFNKLITEHYGQHRSLDNVFSVALQMASFNSKDFLGKNSTNTFPYINPIQDFENNIPKEILEDEEYRFSIAILPQSVNKKNQADSLCTIINPNSEEGNQIAKILIKKSREEVIINLDDIYKHSFTVILKSLKKEKYDINRAKLIKFIKSNNIKEEKYNDYSTPRKTDGKITGYKYSDKFIDLLKKNINKIPSK